VDFCATNNAKIPIIGAAFGVCRVKNRLIGDFLFTCEAQQTPNAPGNLKVQRVHTETAPNTYEDQIEVTWDGAAGAASCKVYWSTSETPGPSEPGFSGGEQTGINATGTLIPGAKHDPWQSVALVDFLRLMPQKIPDYRAARTRGTAYLWYERSL
jgi:hypothetical protein